MLQPHHWLRLSQQIACRQLHHPPPPPFRSQGVGVQEVLRALVEGVRSNDKNARQQLVALLLRLFFFEELPPEAMQLVVPLFQVHAEIAAKLPNNCQKHPHGALQHSHPRTVNWLSS